MFEMKKQLMWAKLKVGIVFTLTLTVLFLTVFFAESIQELFLPKVQIKAQIKDVGGLRKGAPVWFSGVEIGSVKDIKLSPEYGTLVTLSINRDDIHFVKKDSTASVLTMGLLGDKYVEISAGSPGAESVKPGDMIAGSTQLELQDIVETSSNSLAKITEFVEKLDKFVERFEESEGTLAKFLKDPTVYNNLQKTTEELSSFIEDLKQSEGSMKKFMKDPTLYNKILQSASSIEEFTEKINRGSGTLKRLIEDPDLYQNLNGASRQLSIVLQRINSGEGLAGSLVRDQELAIEMKDTLVELKESLREFRELLAEIKEHPEQYINISLF